MRYRTLNIAMVALWIGGVTVFSACERTPTPMEAASPDPLTTVRELLRLHDLLGKQPEDRPSASRNRLVDWADLKLWIDDMDGHEPFLGNLYVGFVVGALARNQGRLFVTGTRNRVQVAAGRARVVLRLKGGRYKIVLAETIPKGIVERANLEMARMKSVSAQTPNK